MPQFKAVIIDDRYPDHILEQEELVRIGAKVTELRTVNPGAEEIIQVANDADALIVNLARIDFTVIDKLSRCKVISRYGVGYDNVDVEAATRKGIRVVNVPDYCMEEVSDQALALFFACVRQIRVRDEAVRHGRWDTRECGPMYRIAGKVFGLVGYGNIPRTLHRKLQGFNLKEVLVYDPFVSKESVEAKGGRLVDLDTLLREADYISVHAPLMEKTYHMFGKEQFSKMKPTAVFINTSRGGLVDTTALYEALKNGTIAWAGIDVHEQEPVPAHYPLCELKNVVLSDHRGWYSEESMEELRRKAARYAAMVLEGKTPHSVVNREVL
ncbi:MAG: C-terminal binding protein [Spirochaetales bacterium]